MEDEQEEEEVSLLGSSCLLISGEQMEESPHFTGDQFHAKSSGSSILAIFISGRGDVTSQTYEEEEENPQRLLQREDGRFPGRRGVQQTVEISYLSSLCLLPSVYPLPLISQRRRP